MADLSAIDPSAMLGQLGAVAQAAIPAVGVVMFTVGMWFVARAGHLMWMGREGRGQHDDVPIGSVLGNLFVGGALIQLNKTVTNTRGTLGGAGSDVRSAMQLMASNSGSDIYNLAMATALIWLALIGVVAIVRGLLLWREVAAGANRGGGNNDVWGGAWHIIGGGILVNVGLG